MRRWSEVAERIAATTRTSEKTQLLAAYLRALDAESLAPATVFFSGRAFAESDGRALGLGWATLADSVMQVAGVTRAERQGRSASPAPVTGRGGVSRGRRVSTSWPSSANVWA